MKGKHDLFWFLSFGGVTVQPFMPPFKPSQSDPFPPNYPQVKLKMDFEGYMRTKPYSRVWEELPSGEYRFCNASMSCSNMETARNYMSYLNACFHARISAVKSGDGTSPHRGSFSFTAWSTRQTKRLSARSNQRRGSNARLQCRLSVNVDSPTAWARVPPAWRSRMLPECPFHAAQGLPRR